MVAKITTGKGIRGVINYNEKKIANAEAKLIMAAGFPRDPGALSFANKLGRFELLTCQNERTKTNAVHISLNFSVRDQVDDELMKQIALDYMERIGFGSQPFLVYRHYDAAHPHIHIATVNIEEGGNRIETHNLGRNQSEQARRTIEQTYGLVRAEDQSKEASYSLRRGNLASNVREITETYRFTSLPELNAVLSQVGIWANPGAEGSRMREKEGLIYCPLDDNGEALGKPVKASAIYSAPTIRNLKKKYQANRESRKPYGVRLRHLLDKAIAKAASSCELEALLRPQGIRILLRENGEGRVYGAVFIDNATRVVFNGSELGKGYGAEAVSAKLSSIGALPAVNKDGPKLPVSQLPVVARLRDLGGSERGTPDATGAAQKRKNRLQAE